MDNLYVLSRSASFSVGKEGLLVLLLVVNLILSSVAFSIAKRIRPKGYKINKSKDGYAPRPTKTQVSPTPTATLPNPVLPESRSASFSVGKEEQKRLHYNLVK